MALNFGTYGRLNREATRNLIEDYPAVKSYMWDRINKTYDDDLKIFLMESLGNIDYLKRYHREDPDTLTHVVFCMEA